MGCLHQCLLFTTHLYFFLNLSKLELTDTCWIKRSCLFDLTPILTIPQNCCCFGRWMGIHFGDKPEQIPSFPSFQLSGVTLTSMSSYYICTVWCVSILKVSSMWINIHRNFLMPISTFIAEQNENIRMKHKWKRTWV